MDHVSNSPDQEDSAEEPAAVESANEKNWIPNRMKAGWIIKNGIRERVIFAVQTSGLFFIFLKQRDYP